MLQNDIIHFLGKGYDSNAYVISSQDESLLVDSGLGNRFMTGANSIKEIESMVKKFSIKNVYLTHAHIDHVGGIIDLINLSDNYSFNLITHHLEAEFLETGKSNYIDPILGTTCGSVKISRKVQEGEKICVGKYIFDILNTPGHTSGGTCLYEKEHKILISGDTVFPGGSFGRTDLPTGNNGELISSLKRLSKLNVELLLSGHMEPVIGRQANNQILSSYSNAKSLFKFY